MYKHFGWLLNENQTKSNTINEIKKVKIKQLYSQMTDIQIFEHFEVDSNVQQMNIKLHAH